MSVHPFFNRMVLVAALGYFVDIYDLVLFSIVRIGSLKDLGFEGAALTEVGMRLLNYQMAGLLLGGVLWGSLGDKRGRLSVLFGSIALYSTANLLNAFVDGAGSYAALRFLAGVGLAGELGAAVTLVVETLPIHLRGYSTAFIAAIGILGAVFAALIADFLNWRVAYAVGGVLGLGLLVTRVRLSDSPLFRAARERANDRGNFLMLFRSGERLKRYLCTIAIGVPCWFVLGILLAFGPEITGQLGIKGVLIVGTGVIFQYTGAAIGDFVSGVVSQRLKNRNWVVGICIGATAVLVSVFLLSRGQSPYFYYLLYFGLGFTTGYWAVFVTIAAEQFGTNFRATAASTAPNFVRGAVIPMGIAIHYLRGYLGLVSAIALVGAAVGLLALWALTQLEDTYARDLDFYEKT